MTRTDHRLGDNFKKNHSNTGQSASQIDRKAWRKELGTSFKLSTKIFHSLDLLSITHSKGPDVIKDKVPL